MLSHCRPAAAIRTQGPRNALKHLLGYLHHPYIILVRHIKFKCCKFRVVRAIHPLVPEHFSEFIYTVKTCHNEPFEI